MSDPTSQPSAEPPNNSQTGVVRIESMANVLKSTNSGSIIVFDPIKKELTTRKLKELDSQYS